MPEAFHQHMNPTRFKIMLGVAAVLLAMLVWNWIAGWGLVTVHASDQPLAKIISSIERQGGIKIVTNADLTSAVSMDVDRVPVGDAVDVLAARLDGNWNVTYVAGAQKSDIVAGIGALQEGNRRNADFAQFGGGGFGGGMDVGDTVIDVRRISWKVSPSDKQDLQSYLDQVAQKTGAVALAPRSWNPSLTATPKGGKVGSAIPDLVHQVHGQVEEIYVIHVRTEDPNRTAEAGGDRGGPGRPDGGFGGGGGPGGRGNFNPQWAQERMDARLAQLPADQREQVKKDFSEMRANWERIRALPEAERRAEMEKIFNSPVFQERMSDRQAARDERSGPQRRAERARQYIQRKQAAMAAAKTSP
jgi:hypothetical protein